MTHSAFAYALSFILVLAFHDGRQLVLVILWVLHDLRDMKRDIGLFVSLLDRGLSSLHNRNKMKTSLKSAYHHDYTAHES